MFWNKSISPVSIVMAQLPPNQTIRGTKFTLLKNNPCSGKNLIYLSSLQGARNVLSYALVLEVVLLAISILLTWPLRRTTGWMGKRATTGRRGGQFLGWRTVA